MGNQELVLDVSPSAQALALLVDYAQGEWLVHGARVVELTMAVVKAVLAERQAASKEISDAKAAADNLRDDLQWLLAVADDLQGRNRHDEGCPSPIGACSCGLDALRATYATGVAERGLDIDERDFVSTGKLPWGRVTQ